MFKEAHFNIFRPCNPQSKTIIQHNTKQTVSACHNMLFSTHLGLAARWQGQHGGLGHRQAALVVVNTMGHVWPPQITLQTVTHSSRGDHCVCVSETEKKKRGWRSCVYPGCSRPSRSVMNTPLPIFCADNPPCKHGVALHKLRCWHWSVECMNQMQRP